jgi:hypothetical protein
LLALGRSRPEDKTGMREADLRSDSVQLAIDINTFLNERQQSSRAGTPKYDAQTVNQYHLKYANRMVKLADDLVASGTPKNRISLLYERQKTIQEVAQMATYLKMEEWKN